MEQKENVLVLTDDEGKESEFEYITTIDMNDNEYVVLLPYVEEVGEEPEDVLILKVETDDDGEEIFSSIDDEAEVEKVFELFKKEATELGQFEFID